MPHGSDPRRRPDQQSPDSGASIPPDWWGSLSDDRLPTEGRAARHRQSWRLRLHRLGIRLSTPAVILTVAGAVVAFSFGYAMVGDVAAALIVVGLLAATVMHHRRSASSRDSNRWR
ncbi:MAG TPA: hypothetical protein VMV12_06345 [Candidatus Micrarchaeaceae archaeon]|nr:hypothetical protein [Candidatus Micrarchaeaceae archaeon]